MPWMSSTRASCSPSSGSRPARRRQCHPPLPSSEPPGVHRALRNIGDVEGILQVVISGGKHDARDIYIPAAVMEALKAKSAKLYEQLTASGISSEVPLPSLSMPTSTT